MRTAGKASWQLSIGDDDMLSAALWIRDAAGIVVRAGGSARAGGDADDVPPPMEVPPPPSGVLAGEDPVAVGRDWLAWWRALLGARLAAHLDPLPDGAGEDWQRWVARDHARRSAISDPGDDFAALAHAPGLRRACRELFRDAARGRTRPRLEATPHEVYQTVVADVSAAHGVDPSMLDGAVVVVPTGAGWWRVLGPGLVIASDDAPVGDVVRAAFESAL